MDEQYYNFLDINEVMDDDERERLEANYDAYEAAELSRLDQIHDGD